MGNYLTFDGLKTSDYGVEISGEGIFSSPERIYDMIEIPGRNGTLALDQGRYANIEVHYPAYNYETTLATFEQKLASLRSDFGSRIGYKRLTDTFHTDEYRLGVFKGGFDIDPVKYNTASQFELVFDCKPQRFLTSGETATAVANNGTITNPTKFASQPLLQVWGYGAVTLTDPAGNANTVNIVSAPIGDITLAEADSWFQSDNPKSFNIDLSLLNGGDAFRIERLAYGNQYIFVTGNHTVLMATNSNNSFETKRGPFWSTYNGQNAVLIQTMADSLSFVKGTSQTITNTVTVEENGSTLFTLTQTVVYNGTSTITVNQTASAGATINTSGNQGFRTIIGTSSQSALGSPIYIDLEIGEAYKIVSDEIVGVNNAVILPAVLPTLKPGNTKITYPNTVTQFKIVPRWWRL